MMKSSYLPILFLALGGLTASCSDMLEHDSDLLVYADREHLNEDVDTIYSIIGIQSKMQALADRTILLGEVRGDLVELNEFASSDLRDIAQFQSAEGNRYNAPRDYYAVINNCNYFIAHADTALRNNRNEVVFAKELAAAKAFRAWTYLQLGLIYGQCPFVTEPILDMNDDESRYPMYDLKQICDYFIQDLADCTDTPLPGYGAIGPVDSRLTFFPVNVLLGELNLWAGNYREAARCYYRYISSRNGTRTAWPLTSGCLMWTRDDGKWRRYSDGLWYMLFAPSAETFSKEGELVTYIAADSVPSSGNFSELNGLFSTAQVNDGYYAIVPSAALKELSAAQVYCNKSTTGEVSYAPDNLTDNLAGDLRLASCWHTYNSSALGLPSATDRPITQIIDKYSTCNVHIWRRSMVYLHMAEALNRAGFPEFAYDLLATGVNNRTMDSLKVAYPADVEFLSTFDFPNIDYVLRSESFANCTTIGLHSRGSGFTEDNEYYTLPTGTLDEQIEAVEDMIANESALELAFEGQRYYDLMRIALRRNNPSYLSNRIQSRGGSASANAVAVNLDDTKNWYLKMYR